MNNSITFFWERLTLLILLMMPFSIHSQVTFTKHTVDPSFNGACSVTTFDIDGDGLIDLIGAGWDGNTIAWWKNDGSNPISWEKNIVDDTFRGASYISISDIDNDGKIDIVGSAWDDNSIAWWHNDGGTPPQWTKYTIDNSFNDAHEVIADDLDNDGDKDIIGAAAGSHTIACWENDGNNPINWIRHEIDIVFRGARSVNTVDINQDGLLDIIGAAFDSHDIALWINKGNFTWTKSTVDANYTGAHKVISADIDNDGDFDLIGAGYYASNIALWRNDGGDPIEWTKQIVGNAFLGALTVCAADVNGDKMVDVIGAAETANDLAIWYNNGGVPITWNKQLLNGNFSGAWPVHANDIDKDGDIDIVAAAYTADDVAWWENQSLVSVEGKGEIPYEFKLNQNYPNPFNPTTYIKYKIPNVASSFSSSFSVTLKVFDILGKELATLVDETQKFGYHKVEFDGSYLANGIYFYKLQVGAFIQTKKMILLK